MEKKALMLGKTGGRRRGWQRILWLDRVTSSMNMDLNKLLEVVEDRGASCAIVHEVEKSQTQLSD